MFGCYTGEKLRKVENGNMTFKNSKANKRKSNLLDDSNSSCDSEHYHDRGVGVNKKTEKTVSENLLGVNEVIGRLNISKAMFYRVVSQLKAKGLQEVRLGNRVNYRAASVDKIIKDAALSETSLCSATAP